MPDTTEAMAVADAVKTIKAELAFTLPGEALMTALVQYAISVRETMNPDLLKRYDAVLVQQVEDWQRMVRGLLVKAGVLQ